MIKAEASRSNGNAAFSGTGGKNVLVYMRKNRVISKTTATVIKLTKKH